MNKPLISLRHVSRYFGKDVALRNISLDLPSKGFVALLGPSGSGKTTLLNILCLLDDDYEGYLSIKGKNVRRFSSRKKKAFRLRNIGYVFQNFSLLEHDDSLSNVMLKLDALSFSKRADKRRKASYSLNDLGLKNKGSESVSHLSGGEKQRVALTRAIINNPPILLCDEPTGALDGKNAEAVFSALLSLSKKRLVLVVSHDEDLCKEYADHLLYIEDGRIKEYKKNKIKKNPSPIEISPLQKAKTKCRSSLSFMLGHAFRILKFHKWRSLLSVSAISFGLAGIGLSFYVSSSISKEINKAFSVMVDETSVVVSLKNEAASGISNVYAFPYKEALNLKYEYPDIIKDVGSSLLLDFESWFCDDNSFYIPFGSKKIPLTGFTTRSINDFLWLDEYQDKHVFPMMPAKMDVEEVVIGLPYQNMFYLCLQLGINRDYQSLGDFLRNNSLKAVLSASHIDWGFQDEEVFFIDGVVPFDSPCLFHLRHDWNKAVILDKMRFRSSLLDENDDPQYVFEIPYVVPSCPYEEFLSFLRKDDSYLGLVLEKASSSYLPSLLLEEKNIDVKRVYLYNADKCSISYMDLDRMSSLLSFSNGRLTVTSGTLIASGQSLLNGFAGKTFFSPSKEDCYLSAEAYSFLPKDIASSPLKIPTLVKDASFLSQRDDFVRVKALAKKEDISMEEVYVSSSLSKKWNSPSEISVYAEISQTEVGDYVSRKFSSGTLKVRGVVEESVDTIYVKNDWNVDYFFCELGMSGFNLEPVGAVFSFLNKEEAIKGYEKLSKTFVNYEWSCPGLTIEESVDETLSYLKVVISAFSFVGFLTSLLLFIVIISITILESKNEVLLMHKLGLSSKDIAKSFRCHTYLYSALSLLLSSLIMVIAMAVVSFYLGKTFGYDASISISPFPLLMMALFAAAFILLNNITVTFFSKKKTLYR